MDLSETTTSAVGRTKGRCFQLTLRRKLIWLLIMRQRNLSPLEKGKLGNETAWGGDNNRVGGGGLSQCV